MSTLTTETTKVNSKTTSTSTSNTSPHTPNRLAVFSTMGASNHSDKIREENDYYATDPKAVQIFLDESDIKFSPTILKPSCGKGHISKVLESNGYTVISEDLIDRGYGKGNCDFFERKHSDYDIVTNPPYKIACKYAKHCLDIVDNGSKVALCVKTLFLEGKERRKLFEMYPPKYVFVYSSRVNCARDGDFDKYTSSAINYNWFVWEKGYKGDTVVKWIN